MKLLEALVLWLIGLWQARRERRLEVLDRKANAAIMWAEDKEFRPFYLKPGTMEQDLIDKFNALEQEVYARQPRTVLNQRLFQQMLGQQNASALQQMQIQNRPAPGLVEQMLGGGSVHQQAQPCPVCKVVGICTHTRR